MEAQLGLRVQHYLWTVDLSCPDGWDVSLSEERQKKKTQCILYESKREHKKHTTTTRDEQKAYLDWWLLVDLH